MTSAIYILDRELRLIIQRQYREDLNVTSILESFKSAYHKSHHLGGPIVSNQGITFVFLQKKELIFMTPVWSDIDVFTQITFLEKFSQLIAKYFHHYKLIDAKNEHITADLVRDNFILIYELFDECFDFGIPQLTEFSVLKDFIKLMIKQEDYYDTSHFNSETNEVEKRVETEINSSISRAAVNKISWRPKGIFYNKNEFFVNFEENLKFKFNHKVHKVITNQISGQIDCKSYLSGMPDLKLGINESLSSQKSILNNIQYHQCVDLNKLQGNTIEFIPPDGEFTLLNYRILDTNVLQPLILVKPQYRIFKKNETYKLRIKVDMVTTFKRKFSMVDVKIRIPLVIRHPILFVDFNRSMKFKTKLGNVIHSLETESLIWKIEKVQGTMRGEMLAEFDLLTEKELWTSHMVNHDRGRQTKNDLFYYEIGSELSKLGDDINPSIQKLKFVDSNTGINKATFHPENNRHFKNKKDIMVNDIERVLLVEFQLQNMLYSGLKVEFLTITEEQLKLQAFPWIMYLVFCKDDDYSFVLGDEEFVNELTIEEEEILKRDGEYTSIQTPTQLYNQIKKDDDGEKNNEEQNKDNFDTVLDHIGKFKIKGERTANFEEYMLSDEEDEKTRTKEPIAPSGTASTENM